MSKFLALLVALITATPASAFAQAYQENVVTPSVISNAFVAFITLAYTLGGFVAIYTIIAASRKAMMFAARTVCALLGAALLISLAGSTGMVAQDGVAISFFSALVLLTGMGAVTFRADAVLTNSEKGRAAAEKARIAKANAEHNAKVEALYEQLGLEASLEAGYKYSVGISQRIINEKKAASLGNNCFTSLKAKHGLGVEIDWSYGVARSRYMGHWPTSDK